MPLRDHEARAARKQADAAMRWARFERVLWAVLVATAVTLSAMYGIERLTQSVERTMAARYALNCSEVDGREADDGC